MPNVSTTDLASARAAGATQLIDVREPSEYVSGHVPGAVSIPMAQLVDRLDEIDSSRPVFVVCQAGGRIGVDQAESARAGHRRAHGADHHRPRYAFSSNAVTWLRYSSHSLRLLRRKKS